MSVVMHEKPDLEAARERLAPLVSMEARRHGWDLRDLSWEADQTGSRWAVGLVGPVEAETHVVHVIGKDTETPYLHVIGGSHGRLEARTLDDLTRLVREWIKAVWGGA